MNLREISYGSVEFRQECELRQEVLRRPLGLNLYDEDLRREADQWHFGLFDGAGDLIGCVIAAPQSTTEAKIRQMAVAPAFQRRGLGRIILQQLEATLVARGFTRFTLHARQSAVPFYEKLGYRVMGQRFVEVTIPHAAMEKTRDQPRPSTRDDVSS